MTPDYIPGNPPSEKEEFLAKISDNVKEIDLLTKHSADLSKQIKELTEKYQNKELEAEKLLKQIRTSEANNKKEELPVTATEPTTGNQQTNKGRRNK